MSNNKFSEIFKRLEENEPLSIFRTEHGYLQLSEKQKLILQKRVFTPNMHIFAKVSELTQKIEIQELSPNYPNAFVNFVEKMDNRPNGLPYTYLGISNQFGLLDLDKF